MLIFPSKPKEIELGKVCGGVWTCGCEGQDWVLYENGVCLCRGCNCISTVLKVVHDPVPAETEKRRLARIAELMERDPASDTLDGEQLQQLASEQEAYEKLTCPEFQSSKEHWQNTPHSFCTRDGRLSGACFQCGQPFKAEIHAPNGETGK